jgi:hypothetical protein
MVAAAGIVVGFLLMTSPAQADTGGLSATLKKTTHAAGLSTAGKHATKTVRHTAKVTHARVVRHTINKPVAAHPVVARKFVPAQRAAAAKTATHRVAAVKTHARHVAGKAAARATKTTGKAARGTAKITTAVSKTAAIVTGSGDIGTIVTSGVLSPIADAGAVLSDAIPPAVQPVLTPTSRLNDRVQRVLQDKIVHSIPPVVDAGGLITDPLHHVGSQPGSGLGIRPSIAAAAAQVPPGSAAAQDHPPSGQPTASTASGRLNAVLSDLASSASQVLLGARASTSGATAAAAALLTIAVGVAAAGSASSGGPAGISFAFVEGGLLSAAGGRARRLGGILRQAGWRTPHRPSFSPD